MAFRFKSIFSTWFLDGVKHGSQYEHINKEIYDEYNQFREEGPKPLFCYVPFSSLTFSFHGKVYACTYNREIVLGRYPENTLAEIWDGAEAKTLREHMRHNDLNYGCQHCKYFFDKKKFSNLKPLVFDKYADIKKINYPKVMEFELSNECNLECQMCSGEVSSSIRKNRDKLAPYPMVYDDSFVNQLEPFIPHLKEAKFFGGEPFLISIYYDIWERMLAVNKNIKFFVITNGSHWNKKIAKILDSGHFDIAISIDSLNKTKLEKIRKNVHHEKLLENIHHFNDYVQKHRRHLSLSFTAQKDNWEDFPEIIEFCNSIKAHIYVSYLELPQHFAISTMSKEELQKIDNFLSTFSFGTSTTYERHNERCFQDFRQYIKRWLASNEQKTYSDYRFAEIMKNDSQLSEVPAEELSLREIEDKYQKKLSDYIDKRTSIPPTEKKEKKQLILSKTSDILTEFDEEKKRKIYKVFLGGSFDSIYEHINDLPVPHLIEKCRELV